MEFNASTIKKIAIGLACFIAFLILNPIGTVPEGSRGLKFTFGKMNETVIMPGLYIRLPIVQKVKNIKITPQIVEKTIEVGGGGAITSDNQTIGATIKVFYRYAPDKLHVMWSKYGEDRIQEIVTASVTEIFKVVIGQYVIFNLPVSQEQIRSKTIAMLKAKLSEYPVDVTEMNILNYDWSDDFDASIKQTMQRAQQVKQKQQELLVTEQEAQKQVKLAEAQKTSTITQAEGAKESAKLMAEAKILEGEGIQKYNQLIASNLNVEIRLKELEIEKIKAEKWNGQYVPNNMYGPIPFDSRGGIKGN